MSTEITAGGMRLSVEVSEDGSGYLLTLWRAGNKLLTLTLSDSDALVNWMRQGYVLCAMPGQVHLLELECAAEPDEPGAGESPFTGAVPSWLAGGGHEAQPELDSTAEQFGGCPVCGRCEHMLYVGPDCFGVCHEHRLYWYIGDGVYGGAEGGPEDWQRNAATLSEYRLADPAVPGEMPSLLSGIRQAPGEPAVDLTVWGDALDDALKGLE